MDIMNGQKVAVCGSVGSGKSSLLCAIMGEIPRVSGAETRVVGSRAYVPQSAWIQTGTVQDNVLFGKAMDKAQYDEVLQACALDKDVELWANGDMTVVGERGMNLSGGQKQRIQLDEHCTVMLMFTFWTIPSVLLMRTPEHTFSRYSADGYSTTMYLLVIYKTKLDAPVHEFSIL